MARTAMGTGNASIYVNVSRPVIVPWTHVLQSLDKQTALSHQSYQSLKLRGLLPLLASHQHCRVSSLRQFLHVEGMQQEPCASKDMRISFFS